LIDSYFSGMTLLMMTPAMRTWKCWHRTLLSSSSSKADPSPPLATNTMSAPTSDATLALLRPTIDPTAQCPVPSSRTTSLDLVTLPIALSTSRICSLREISPSTNFFVYPCGMITGLIWRC
jgi:hypothetical protein